MPKTSRRKRHRILALVAAGAMALVVVLVVAIVVIVLRRPASQPGAVPPTALPPSAAPGGPTTTKKPRPEFQDASCPDVLMISIPGTWESSLTARPASTPCSSRRRCCSMSPTRSARSSARIGWTIFTVPYTAQFHNPLSADNQMSYNDSRAEGTRAAAEGDHRHEQPLPADQLCARWLLAGRGDRRATSPATSATGADPSMKISCSV